MSGDGGGVFEPEFLDEWKTLSLEDVASVTLSTVYQNRASLQAKFGFDKKIVGGGGGLAHSHFELLPWFQVNITQYNQKLSITLQNNILSDIILTSEVVNYTFMYA